MLLGRTPNLADPFSKTVVKANAGKWIFFGGGWFVALSPRQQQWSCEDCHFTKPHFFPGQA